MNLSRIALLAAALIGTALPALSQTYPTRSIALVVPFSAGGPTDTIARIMAERLSRSLGQTVIVENVTGAGGSIGVGKVARATPDGYTLGIGHIGTHVIVEAVQQVPYDVLKDLEPVAMIATNPQVIVSKNAVPAKDLKELIQWVKANQDKVSSGTGGAGTPSHVSGVYFQNATGAKFQIIHYRGAAPAMQDLLAGHIDITFDQAANSLPQIRGGKIKVYAVTAPKRLAAAPEIPGSARNAACRDREAQRRHRRIPRRSRGAQAPRGPGPGDSRARAADARGARRASQGGDRQVVAAHQAGGDQGGVRGTP